MRNKTTGLRRERKKTLKKKELGGTRTLSSERGGEDEYVAQVNHKSQLPIRRRKILEHGRGANTTVGSNTNKGLKIIDPRCDFSIKKNKSP